MLASLVSPHKGRMALLSVVSFVGALLEALFIVIVTGIAMALVGGVSAVGPVLGRSLSVPTALVSAAGALLVRLLLSLWGVRISARLVADVTTDQRRQLAHAYLWTTWAVQQAEPTGRLQELLTSFVQRVTGSVSTLTNSMTAGLSLLAFLSTGLLVNPLATAAVLLALAGVGGILTPLRRRIRSRSAVNAKANLSFANAVSELGALGLEMQSFGAESAFERRIDALTAEATLTQRRTQVLQGSLPYVYMSLAYAAVLAGVGALSWLGPTDLGAVGAVMLLMVRSLSYGQQLATSSAALASNAPFLAGVCETVQRYRSAPASTGTTRPAGVTPLEAEEMDFAYAGRPALGGVTFRLEPGEAIGVIGPSGAGKSTLAQLLLGLRPPTGGSLRAADVRLSDIDRAWWTERVAFVPQDAQLITGTVAENIRFFRDGIDDNALIRAARRANVLNDIERLPRGFDTHLGERGSELSGGQRQRLSIARALAAQPELLILDEPTSALDGQSESLIRETLAELRGSISIVIIAHRLSTLDICDRIMVVEQGRLTGLDNPRQLRDANAFYRNALKVAGMSR